jgi:hypothetical protein
LVGPQARVGIKMRGRSELRVFPETVMRDWKVAKVWLARELERGRRDG